MFFPQYLKVCGFGMSRCPACQLRWWACPVCLDAEGAESRVVLPPETHPRNLIVLLTFGGFGWLLVACVGFWFLLAFGGFCRWLQLLLMACVGFWLLYAFGGFCWLLMACVGLAGAFSLLHGTWYTQDISRYDSYSLVLYLVTTTYRLKNPRVSNDRACIGCGFGQSRLTIRNIGMWSPRHSCQM